MTPSYTVTEIETPTPREWSANGSPMHSYRVKLKNDQGAELGNVEVNYKPGNSPSVGEVIEGEVDTSGQYGPKLKKAKKGNYGGGGGGGQRGHSPEERASIQAQTACKVAGEVVVALASKEGLQTVEAAGAALEALTAKALGAIKAGL